MSPPHPPPHLHYSLHSLRPCLRHDHDHDHDLPLPSDPFPFPFAAYPVPATHVHFPPTPNLTSTHLTHDRHTYDRAPITVAPNLCALPDRNDRTYTPSPDRPRRRRLTPGPPPSSSSSPSPASIKGSYFHPRAYEACQREPTSPSSFPTAAATTTPPVPIPVPALVPDISSSESDESDAILTPPEPLSPPAPPPHRARFLPHAPDPADHAHAHLERGRKRSPSAAGRRRPHRVHAPALRRSEFAAPELDGCLGGF